MSSDLTQQDLDPIANVTGRPLVIAAGAAVTVFALVLTIAHGNEIRSMPAAVLGVLLVAAAGAVAVGSTSGRRAPFTVERLWLVIVLAVAAAIAEYLSTIGANRYLSDDYGAAVIGVLLLALAPYATWRALAAAGGVATVVLSILVVGAAPYTWSAAPLPILVLAGATIALGLGAAAAVYSWTAVATLLSTQRAANRRLLRSGDPADEFDRAGHPSAVSVLRGEVLPFLARVMTSDRITVADADRARELVEALRSAVRAGAEATWLDELATELRLGRDVDVIVDDEASEAQRLRDDQRVLVTGLMMWLSEHGIASAHVLVRRDDPEVPGRGRIVVAARTGLLEPDVARLEWFAPLGRAAGITVDRVEVGENVRVELGYGID
ncbi:hypothetical protein ACGGZK_17335 [Agromyces sp. MMS24-K17]|uniref:hypothetical protein n=1 Tax=Agromyces sp. MMS24-K17 TaxID=3372850 RepID=UPI003754C982